MEQGEHLNGFAQAHVVGQDTAEPESLKREEPAQAGRLVGAQGGAEARRGSSRGGGGGIVQPPERLAVAAVEVLQLFGQQRVEQRGLLLAEAYARVVSAPFTK